jgi:hypothetical protein
MKIQAKLLGAALAGVATVLAAAPSYAVAVMSNLPLPNTDQETVLNGSQEKGLSFTVQSGFNWSLDSVALRLGGFDSGDVDITSPVSGGDQTYYNVSLRADNNGSPSANPILLFTNPLDPTGNSPTSGGQRTWTFTPNSSYTLASNRKYWIVVSGNAFTWKASEFPDTPPTGTNGFTTSGYKIKGFNSNNNNSNQSWTSSSISNGIAVNASNPVASVPFDFSATPGLLLVGGLWGTNKLRRRGSEAKLIKD